MGAWLPRRTAGRMRLSLVCKIASYQTFFQKYYRRSYPAWDHPRLPLSFNTTARSGLCPALGRDPGTSSRSAPHPRSLAPERGTRVQSSREANASHAARLLAFLLSSPNSRVHSLRSLPPSVTFRLNHILWSRFVCSSPAGATPVPVGAGGCLSQS